MIGNISILAKVELFVDLTEDELGTIARICNTKTYPKNSIIINEGDQSNALFIILRGKVKAYVSDEEGKEATLNIQVPGEHFGELALIDDEPRSASIITLETCQLAIISKDDFQKCLTENPPIAVKLLSLLSQRIRILTERVKELSLVSVHGRVAHLLLQMAVRRDEQFTIEPRLTHQEIASLVGASREMVSRVMKELNGGGYIKIASKKIIIEEKLEVLRDTNE
jgi:CRP/FNR family cyclic AMP-dependent transcriptional regulator